MEKRLTGGPGGGLVNRSRETEQRRLKIEDLLLKGVSSIDKIAAAVGVSWPTANNDIKVILTNWADKHRGRDFEERLAARIEQIMQSVQAAWTSYQRSRRDQEEIRTVYEKVVCKDCKGTGMKPDSEEWCDGCGGDGTKTEEVVTRTVKGTAGSPAFLSLYQKGIEMAARMEGTFIEREEQVKRQYKEPEALPVPTTTINIAMQKGRINFGDVPDELILECKGLLDKIGVTSGKRNVIEDQRKNADKEKP